MCPQYQQYLLRLTAYYEQAANVADRSCQAELANYYRGQSVAFNSAYRTYVEVNRIERFTEEHVDSVLAAFG